MADIKIIRDLMGYTTDAAYTVLNRLPSRDEIASVLMVNTWQNARQRVIFAFFVVSDNFGKYITQPKRSKIALPGHRLLHARRCFIGAVVPEVPSDLQDPGLTKPSAFLRHRSPDQRRANKEQDRTSPALFTQYRQPTISHKYARWQPT